MSRLLAVLLVAPSLALAQNEEVHPYTKANIAPVGVTFDDKAEDGCWTNASETPAIVKAALKKVGIAFTDAEDAKTTLHLMIDAERDGSGCYGNSRFDLRGPATWEGEPVTVVLRESGANFIGQNRLDEVVPLLVNHMVLKDLGSFPDE